MCLSAACTGHAADAARGAAPIFEGAPGRTIDATIGSLDMNMSQSRSSLSTAGATVRAAAAITTALIAASLPLFTGCASGPIHRRGSSSAAAAPAQPATAAASAEVAAETQQVTNTELAFAQTLADRDLKSFLSFLSTDAIFFSGSTVEHGPAEIANVWAPFFNGSHAPFSWRPDHVEVTPDGRLALSTGPVLQEGRVVGRFNSVWRLESPNSWRIVFDKGEAVCGPGGLGSLGGPT